MASNAISPPEATVPPRLQAQIRVRREVPVALWPIVVVIYATILPRQVALTVSDLVFYADRIGYVLVLPYVVYKISQGAIRMTLPDFLVLLTGVWMIAAMSYHMGIGGGLQSGGSLALDLTVGYFLARISFRSLRDMRRVLILVAPGIFLAALSVMAESIMHRQIVAPLAEQVFGRLNIRYGAVESVTENPYVQEVRLGLMRGMGPFAHSIHAGLFLASWLSLYAMGGIRGWPRVMGIASGFMAIFSMSSAAWQSLLLSLGLMAYDKIQASVRELSWRLLVIGSFSVAVILNTISNGGLVSVVGRFLTFNPATAYYRQLIWEYGWRSVKAHPLFGIGFDQFERPVWMISQSVDAHWLLMAVRYGLPAALALFAATLLAIVSLAQASVTANRSDRSFYRGIAIALFVMAYAMFTVTLWGNLQSLFNIMLGGCVACAQHTYRRVRITA